jgi:2,5-diamino-6-(ribosylamino)-4(3H)-pyrimidinone 5'-phosphate reductase
MLPKVVIYDSVSVDGAIKDFDVNIPLHYIVASRFAADAMLVGSVTSKTGIEMFMQKIPQKEPAALSSSIARSTKHLWVIVDSKGSMQGLMHVKRSSKYTKKSNRPCCKSTPILILNNSKKETMIPSKQVRPSGPTSCLRLKQAIWRKTVVTDTGGYWQVAFEQGLAAEVHLLVHL